MNIAIDGPAGAGKSSVARLVADALGYTYVDTGAMYRALTWYLLEQRIPVDQKERVIEAARNIDIRLEAGRAGQQVFVNGQEVTGLIRTAAINQSISVVASIPEVREVLVRLQQKMAESRGVVMDGRDIATHVIPDAEVKVFLTASPHERALRRYKELNDPTITLEQLEQDIIRRDRLDQERAASPLVQAHDAVLLDSTNMDQHEVVQAILSLCQIKAGGG